MYNYDETIVLIGSSELFDGEWYLNSYRDVVYMKMDPAEHYLSIGAKLGRNPSAKFNTSFYLETNPDVDEAGINPLLHYITNGIKEGRAALPFNMISQERDQAFVPGNISAPIHQKKTDKKISPTNGKIQSTSKSDFSLDIELILSSELFDQTWYLNTYPDVAKGDTDPLIHYIRWGAMKGRDPNPMFDSSWYLEQNPDCQKSCTNPLTHFILYGVDNRCDPHPLFSTDWYLNQYPDVDESKLNPLDHYIRIGSKKGYLPHPSFKNLRLPRDEKIKSELYKLLHTSPILCRVPPAQYLTAFRGVKKLHHKYGTLGDYLRQTTVRPNLMSSDLCENDIRIISMMDNHKQRLTKKYAERTQTELVTVIMPTRNRAKIISGSIMSVIAQSYTNWELLIVDDASEENTHKVVQAFDDPRIRFEKLEVCRGNAAARNFGAMNARGTITAYLDDDDQWDPDFLLLSVHTLRETNSRMLYSAQLVWEGFNEILQLGRKFKTVRFAPFNRSLLENANYISMIACVHDTSLFDECGGFNESLNRFVDWDLFLRFTERETPKALPCILSHYYQGRDQKCVTLENSLEENLKKIRCTLNDRANWSRRLTVNDGRDYQAFGISQVTRTTRSPILAILPKSMIRIIIPNYESIRELEICLSSIDENTSSPYEVLIIDNRSSVESRAMLSEIVDKYTHMKWIPSDENAGFSYAVNSGLKEVSDIGDDVVIINNDTIVTPGWLEELRYVLYKHPDVGMSVPRQVLPPGHRIAKAHAPCTLDAFEVDINLSAHHDNVLDPFFDAQEGFIEVVYAPLFCSLVRGTTLREIGLLDTGNGPHFRSDWILCDAIRSWLKQRIVYTPFSKVYHLQGVATEIEKKRK